MSASALRLGLPKKTRDGSVTKPAPFRAGGRVADSSPAAIVSFFDVRSSLDSRRWIPGSWGNGWNNEIERKNDCRRSDNLMTSDCQRRTWAGAQERAYLSPRTAPTTFEVEVHDLLPELYRDTTDTRKTTRGMRPGRISSQQSAPCALFTALEIRIRE